MRTEHVTLNSQPFFLRRRGSSDLPPLPMLHGFPEYGDTRADLAPHLTRHFHCVFTASPSLQLAGKRAVSDHIETNSVHHSLALPCVGAP